MDSTKETRSVDALIHGMDSLFSEFRAISGAYNFVSCVADRAM